MEIVLLWLDELDDLAFACFALWQRLRRLCLGLALCAALGLHALPGLALGDGGALALIGLSLASLALWIVGGAMSAQAERSRRPAPGSA